MSASQSGYATRSKSAVNSVRRLARDDAWVSSEQGGGLTAHECEWDVMALLRRACMRVEVVGERSTSTAGVVGPPR